MERRELLMLGGLALAGAAAPDASVAQAPTRPPQTAPGVAWTSFLHVWTDDKGVSHADYVPVSGKAASIPISNISIQPVAEGASAWHVADNAHFFTTLEGELEIEVSDGTRLSLPPSHMAYLEDTTGKGHIVRSKKAVNLHMQTAPGFDVRRWARGEA